MTLTLNRLARPLQARNSVRVVEVTSDATKGTRFQTPNLDRANTPLILISCMRDIEQPAFIGLFYLFSYGYTCICLGTTAASGTEGVAGGVFT